jgi:hypothetical protein
MVIFCQFQHAESVGLPKIFKKIIWKEHGRLNEEIRRKKAQIKKDEDDVT